MRKKEAKEKYQEQTAKRCRLSPLRASTFKSRKKIRITNKRSDLKKKKKKCWYRCGEIRILMHC
jgi:hypothetical protein